MTSMATLKFEERMLYQPLNLFDLITFSGNWFRWHMIYVTHQRHFRSGCISLRPWSRMQQHFQTHGCCCSRTFPTCFLNQQLFCICGWCCCCCCWCCLVVSYDISSLFSQSTAVLHVFYSVIVVVVVGNVNVVVLWLQAFPTCFPPQLFHICQN